MSGVWKRAPLSVGIASGALTGASAAVWFEAANRTQLAPAAVAAGLTAGALVLAASDRMLRAARRGEDSAAAGRLVGFVIVTEVLAAATRGVLGVVFELAAAMGLLLSTGRVTLAARHLHDRADAEFAPPGAVELPKTTETTKTTEVAGVGTSLSAREGADL